MRFEIRGIVEGFYGTPWRHEDRLWCLERIGRWGMNFYAHAPKQDPFHRDRWREPWPSGHLEAFAELFAAGERCGVTVCPTLAPGLSIRYSDPSDRAALVAKYAALVERGARSLGLLLDDVPTALAHDADRRAFGSAGAAHGALAEHLREALGPGLHWWVCPTDYLGVAPSPYLEELGAALHPETDVAWTGRTVCTPAIAAEEAAPRAAALRRRLLVWDNVPVSDGPMRWMLHLGPYGGRDPALARHVRGILLNPMCHARASHVTVHTAAAYLADPEGYEPEAAWQAALAELGDGAADAFALFAQAHRFSPLWPEHRDAPLEQALRPLRAALCRGEPDREAALSALDALTLQLEARLAAGPALADGLTDRVLADELAPWIESHRLETQRMVWALEAVAKLLTAEDVAGRARALFGLELRLGSEPQPRAVSYGPRRVLYPQLRSMFEHEMGLGDDPALVRDRSLADEVVRLAEDLALARLAPPARG